MSGHPIPDSRYAGDAGDPDPAVAAALAAHVTGRASGAEVLVALAASRLLVPIVAVAAEGSVRDDGAPPSGGPRSGAMDKRTEMALVTITGRDGRRALPVFTSTAALAAWRADARPVPVPARLAAQAALTEGAAALLVDPAGPVRHVVEGARIRELAAGAVGVPAHLESDG